MLHVYADLVGTARFQDTLYDGDIPETFQYFIVGNGFFSVLAFGIGIEQFAKALVSAYMSDDRACVLREVAPNKGHILPAHGMIEELFGKAADRPFRFGEHHEAARILVDAVYEAEAGECLFAYSGVLLLQVPRDTIDQGAGIVTTGGVDDYAGRFINDHDLIVFVADVEGKLFRDDLFPMAFFVRVDDDLIEGSDLIVWLYLFVVDEYHPCFQRFLDLVAGGVFDPLNQELVDTQRFLPLVHLQVEPFVQFVGTVGSGAFFLISFLPPSFVHNRNFCKVSTFTYMQKVVFRDLGRMEYQEAWDYQEKLLQENLGIKVVAPGDTTHHLLFVEHPPVYTLGKSGRVENVLIGDERMREKGVQFFRTNRGGDITFHGPGQLVGYPILDLEKFYTDIGLYLRSLEEVTIRVLAGYGLCGDRSPGETGVWIEPGVRGRERKICAIGVRCSRWVTMHGFALNVGTDLSWFGDIVPCGIPHKQVTSMEKELGRPVKMEEVKAAWRSAFEKVFQCEVV
jgi:lipoyl(octanoyl) transferase